MILLIFICFITVNAGPPVFNEDNSNVTAKENVILKVRCSATGDPEPTYEWYNELAQKVGPHIDPTVWVENDADSGSLLVFNGTSKYHSGGYTCVAQNSHGLRSKVFEVNIIGAREDEGSVKVVNVTETSVVFSIAPHSANETYDLKYSEIYEKRIYYATFNEADKDTKIKISRLLPSGLYSFNFSRRVRSRQEKGWTLNLTVTLLPARPEVIFHKLYEGLLTFSWLRIPEDSVRKTIDKYNLTYTSVSKVSGKDWRYNECRVSIEIPACSSSQYTLASLSKNQWYEISLRAHTSAGYGEPFRNKIYIT